MPVTNTDAVLWYRVGIFGELGYGVPNWSDDPGSLNPNILDLVELIGSNLFAIMHHEDVDLRQPPSINTIMRIHRLYQRSAQILAARAKPPGEVNMETAHVQPGGEVFRVYPIPFFKVRNQYLKRWAALAMMAMSEAMQHTENRRTIEISRDFAGQVGQYLTRLYYNLATELFGKTAEEAKAPGFLLADADLAAYDPSKWFTRVELVDTVPNLGYVFTEDQLAVIRGGILTTNLPSLQPYPTNLTSYYQSLTRPVSPEPTPDPTTAIELGAQGAGAAAGTTATYVMPPAPGP